MARQVLCVRIMVLVLIASLMVLELLLGVGASKAVVKSMPRAKSLPVLDELRGLGRRQDPVGREKITEQKKANLDDVKHDIDRGIPPQVTTGPAFSVSSFNPCANQLVQFNAPNTGGTTYNWDFGDGSPTVSGTSLFSPSHAYVSPGPFDVTLTLTGSSGNVSSSQQLFVTNCLPINNSQSNWFFGYFGELHFNTGVALPGNAALSHNTIFTSEASTAQSDASGNLLFYTDGRMIWNGLHALVNGGLNGGDHPVQTLSVPDPADPNPNNPRSFYLISMRGHIGVNNTNGNFGFTKISISGSNLTLSSVNTPITPPAGADNRIAEMVTAVPGCAADYWIIVHGSYEDPNPDFRHALFVYHLTAAGIGPATVHPIVGPALFGALKASPDGTRIAYGTGDNRSADKDGSNSGYSHVLDFNRKTGVPSNPRVINRYAYGVSFSPNSQLLYLTESVSGVERIFQYDLRTANLNDGEKLVADVPAAYSALQLGPDNKIYVALDENNHLAVIHYPDERNTPSASNACGYSFNGPFLNIPSSSTLVASGFGLPNMIDVRKTSVTPIACCPIITLNTAAGTLPGGVTNTPYSQMFTATGGTGPYAFTVSSGNLPTGLLLNADGTLHGTPTIPGTYSFTVKAADTSGCIGERPYQIIISCATITLSPAVGALPGAVTNTTYSQMFTATGGTGPYAFTVSSGNLPTGLLMDADGALHGTPTTPGTYSFTVKAVEANGCFGERLYQINVSCATITLNPTAGALLGGVTNTPYSQTFTASGGTGPYVFTVSSGILPAGLLLDSDGALHGTPTTPGTYSFTVKAAEANGCIGERLYQINVSCATITLNPAASALPGGVTNQPYGQTFTATGGTGPYVFSVSTGTLPPGMSLSADGTLQGTPTLPGTYSFTVKAAEANGCIGERLYQINVSCATITLSPAVSTLPGGVTNTPYSQTFTASGGTGPYAFTVSMGTLPPGMSLNADGTLQGTPVTPGTYRFTVTATDAKSCSGFGEYTIIVTCPAITINPVDLPVGTTGTPYSQTITATGGCAPHTFSVLSESMPPGLTLAPNGTLSGTPTLDGKFTFTVKANDNCGCSSERTYLLIVNCGDLGRPYTYRAGNIDNFASPNDLASASAALRAESPNAIFKNFDATPTDRFVGHTFTSLSPNIVKAELEVRMKPEAGSSHTDSINLAITPGNPIVSWGILIKDLPQNASQSWNPGEPAQTFIFDLANLPASGSNPTNLIADLATRRYLDVVIEDDTTVDYIKLRVWTCPLRRYFGGLPHGVVGQAQLARDSLGNLVVSNFGSGGEDGVEVGLGNGSGFNWHWLEVGDSSLPNGAFFELRHRGVLDGMPNQLLARIRNTKIDDSFAASADYSLLGTIAYKLNFYRLGQLVESKTVNANGSDGSTPLWTARKNQGSITYDLHNLLCIDGVASFGGFTFPCPCASIPGPNFCLVQTWSALSPVTIGDLTVDAVAIDPVTPTHHTASLESVEFVGARIPSISFTDINISAFGLPHHALGAATLEAFSGNVALANLGASGEDGVKIDLGKADTFNFQLDPIDLMGRAPVGAFLQAEAFGSRDGALDQSLGKLRITKGNSDYQFTVNFSTIGSTTQRIQLFNNNALVLDLPGHTAAVGTASAWPRKMGHKANGFTSDFGPGTTFLIDGMTYQGNQLRVIAEGSSGFTDFKSAFALKGSGIDEFTLTVAQVDICPPAIEITPATLPAGTPGTTYPSTQLSATAGTAPFTFAASGNVPPGLVLDSDGTLHGTPVTQGTFTFNVTVAGGDGCLDVRQYQIVIGCPAITLDPAAGVLPVAVVNTPYSQSFTAMGGCTSSFSYRLMSGALPAGLTLGANGLLAGTAATAGDFSFSVSVTDSCGCSKTQDYMLKVQSATNAVHTKTLVISAFRENGPNGAGDEFIEIFNPSSLPVTISNLSGDSSGAIGVFSSAGNGTASNDVSLRCVIPGATVIKARGWFLCGGSQYSLSNLGGNGGTFHSVPDATIFGDIPNDAGLALLNIGGNNVTACQGGNCSTGFKSPATPGGDVTVLDKVGFRPYGLGAPSPHTYPSLAPNYCEGTCLEPVGDASTITPTLTCPPEVGPASDPGAFPVLGGGAIDGVPVCYGESGQYAIVRRRSEQQFSSSAGDLHRDTDNNADDFILVASNPSTGNVGMAITGISGVSSVLGAAGPHNGSAPPIVGTVIHAQDAFDICSGAVTPCTPGALSPRNAVRRYVPDAYGNAENDPSGTFILRRRFTSTLGPTNGARYRIDDITTLCGAQSLNIGSSIVATQEARNLRGPDFAAPNTTPIPSCQGEGRDSGVFTAVFKALNHGQEIVIDSSGTARMVLGSVLEDTSAGAVGTPAVGRHQPFGGGGNSSFVATTATAPVGDGVNGGIGSFAAITGPPGHVFRIAFKFGVVRSGRFKLLLGSEVNIP